MDARARRAVGLIAIAVTVVVASSTIYLHSTSPSKTTTAIVATPSTIDRSLVTGDLVEYAFTSASVGWAMDFLQSPPLHFADQFWLFQTGDGGKHWHQQLTGKTGFQGPAPYSMQFFDNTHGFVFVRSSPEQLFRTVDGGGHWNALNLPAPEVTEVAFGGPRFGLLLAGGGQSTLYVTNDGGGTWQRLPDPPADAGSLSVRNPTEAWMGSAGLTVPHVYSSGVAGESWQRHDLPAPPAKPWTDGGYSANVELLPRSGVAVYVPPFNQPQLVFINFALTSFDRGTTWRYVPPPPGVVAHQDALHWWAIAGTALFKSSDAGQSWTVATNTLPMLQFVPHVLDAKHAWAVTIVAGGYGLSVTSDGGLHWASTMFQNGCIGYRLKR